MTDSDQKTLFGGLKGTQLPSNSVKTGTDRNALPAVCYDALQEKFPVLIVFVVSCTRHYYLHIIFLVKNHGKNKTTAHSSPTREIRSFRNFF